MKRTLILLLTLVPAFAARAQHKVVADKIVGIVGNKIILKSDVYNEILDRQRRGESVPENADCAIMEQMLILKALVVQAEKDSIVVGDDEIEALLDNQIRGFINAYGSKEALEQIAGRSVYQIKEDFRQSFRERKLADRMREKVVENVKVTPQEVKEYFDQIPKDSLPFLESEVEIGQIVVYPKASREFEKLAQDELKEYKQEVESGQAKFETLASLYSDDPAVKQNNGQYTINRNEKVMDPAFIANAFRLKEGQISPVFKTKFGYHIIQMVSRAGDDAIVRHILRIPRITETQVKEAEDKLDSIRAKLITGALSFGEAASKYSEDENQKFTAGLLQNPNGGTYLTIDMLDKDLVLSLRGMKVGEYSEPVVYTDDRQRKAVRIIYLKSRTQPHRENMKDDYDRLAQQALEIKKQQTLEKWFASKVPSYYIMIDPSFANCADLGQWWQYASKGSQ